MKRVIYIFLIICLVVLSTACFNKTSKDGLKFKKEYETNNRNLQYRRELRKQFYHPEIDNYERVREDFHEINISTIKFYKDLADKWEQCNGQHQDNTWCI